MQKGGLNLQWKGIFCWYDYAVFTAWIQRSIEIEKENNEIFSVKVIFQSKIRLDSWIFLRYNVKNTFAASL